MPFAPYAGQWTVTAACTIVRLRTLNPGSLSQLEHALTDQEPGGPMRVLIDGMRRFIGAYIAAGECEQADQRAGAGDEQLLK